MNKAGNHQHLHYYQQDIDSVISELKSHKAGLTNAEASRRLTHNGPNRITSAWQDPGLVEFFSKFARPLNLLLILATLFSIYIGDVILAFITAFVAIINASLEFIQDYRTSKTSNLGDYFLPQKSKVLRSSSIVTIDAQDIVLGDIVYLSQGDIAPADLRIIDDNELWVDDSEYTGQSGMSSKTKATIPDEIPLENRHNMVLAGTKITSGEAHGIVVATGMYTELGRISSIDQIEANSTQSISIDSTRLTKLMLQVLGSALLLLIIIGVEASLPVKVCLAFAISLIIAVVPSTLSATINTALAKAIDHLSHKKVLVRRPSAVPVMSNISLLFVDKSGILTEHEVVAGNFLIGRNHYQTTGQGFNPSGKVLTDAGKELSAKQLSDLQLLFDGITLTTDAKVYQPDSRHNDWYVMGSANGGALVTLARKSGINTELVRTENPEIKRIADHASHLTISVRNYSGKKVVFVKGSSEQVLKHCTKLWDHGHSRKFTAKDHEYINGPKQKERLGLELVLAYKELPKNSNISALGAKKALAGLTFVGLIKLQEPVRQDTLSAISLLQRSNIPLAIMADNSPSEALAFANSINLNATKSIEVITSAMLNSLADNQVLELMESGSCVFSQISGNDKLRLVEIAKKAGHRVAVTGTALGDGAALRRADVGLVPVNGRPAKIQELADVLLINSGLNGITEMLKQSQRSFRSIQQMVASIITNNVGQFILVIAGLIGLSAFGIPSSLTAMQLILLDVVVLLFPISALAFDKSSIQIKNASNSAKGSLLGLTDFSLSITFGVLAAILAYGNFLLFFSRQGLSPVNINPSSHLYYSAITLTLVTLAICQLINIFFVRATGHKKFFTSFAWQNSYLVLGILVSLFLLSQLVYSPIIQNYLHTGPLSGTDILTALLAGIIYFLFRLGQRHMHKHSRSEIIRLHHEIHGKGSTARI